MKTFTKTLTPLLIALAMGTFTACSDSNDANNTEEEQTDTTSYIINATENKDVPIGAKLVSVSSEEADVELTRNVEANTTNVYVISGSVEVTEVVEP